MKKLFLLSMVMGVMSIAHAQKINLQTERFDFHYFHLPDEVLSKELKTYTTDVVSSAQRAWQTDLLEAELAEKYLTLYGFDRVEENGDLRLELEVGNPKKTSEKLEKYKVSTKDTGDRYKYNFTYEQPLLIRLMKGEEELLTLRDRQKASFSSSSFTSAAEAKKSRDKNLSKWFTKARKERIAEVFTLYSNRINLKYGYLPDTERIKLLYAKVKKAPSLEAFKTEVMEAKALIEAIVATEAVSEQTKQRLQSQAAAWAEAATPLDLNDKQQSRLFGAYLHNAMVVCYAVDDYEMAAQYARQLVEADQETREAKRMLDEIEKIKERLIATGLAARHHDFGDKVPDWEAMKAAEKRRKKMGLHEKAYEQPVTVYLKEGKAMEGVFVIDTAYYEDMVFFDYQGNIKYFREDDDGPQRLKINFLELDSLTMGDRHVIFETGDLVKARVGAEAPFRALERLTSAGGNGLFFAFPDKKSSIDEGKFDVEYWLRKKGEEAYLAVDSKEELAEKGSAYFSDCPELAQKIGAGEYGLSEAELTELVKVYSDCSK
jgi:hypothetical protein